MALSGNQTTRIGIIGFPGRPYAGFTAKSETVITFLTFGVLSFMSQTGASVKGSISTTGIGLEAKISQSAGVFAIIRTQGIGVNGNISDSGIGIKDKL